MVQCSLLRLALTTILLIPALGGSSLAYVCEMNGKIQRKCCCDHDAAASGDCAELAKPGCCDVRPAGGESATKSTQTVTSYQLPTLAFATTVAGLASLAADQRPGQCDHVGTTGPPIFLRNCSLLR
jgi:hypothetical protein